MMYLPEHLSWQWEDTKRAVTWTRLQKRDAAYWVEALRRVNGLYLYFAAVQGLLFLAESWALMALVEVCLKIDRVMIYRMIALPMAFLPPIPCLSALALAKASPAWPVPAFVTPGHNVDKDPYLHPTNYYHNVDISCCSPLD